MSNHQGASTTEASIDSATAKPSMLDRILAQGPWDQIETLELLHGAPSLPMPVKIASPESLIGCFNHLQEDGNEAALEGDTYTSKPGKEPYYNVPFVEYDKGVIYADRRLDLCKMVLGPLNIDKLMDSLETNRFIRHFLLGNNIIGPAGARRIAKFIGDHPNRMDTWYLAGNCIDQEGLGQIVESLVDHNSIASNIWLKRNPLGPQAASDLARLIVESQYLETLDLDQTELGDAGISQLFDMLSGALARGKLLKLRHIYLNAVGIGTRAAIAIGRFLATESCQLQSLFVSNNPIGDAGAEAFARGLSQNHSLIRFMASSIGVTSVGAKAIFVSLKNHETISAVDLGQSFATVDLSGRFNYIDDDACLSLIGLLQSTTLKHLVVDHLAMSHASLNQIYAAGMSSRSICWLETNSISNTSGSNEVVRARLATKKLLPLLRSHLQANVKRIYGGMDWKTFEADEKRWLASPKDAVRKIDSVYRNRDAGLARRGLMKLDKWWDVDDPTLEEVMAS